MKSSHQPPKNRTITAETPALIGKLRISHIIFFVLSGFMALLTIYIHHWTALIGVLILVVAGLTLTAQFNLRRYNKLTRIWSELARQTGLELERGHLCLIGVPDPPAVSGHYRGRQLRVSKVVQNIGNYEGSVSAVFTCVTLAVARKPGWHMDIHAKPFLLSFFRTNATGNKYFDRYFKCEGNPLIFVQKTAHWVSQQPALYERPSRIMMLTDNLLSFSNWSAPSIQLEDSKLICLQAGVVSNVCEEINILNLLCDLADFIEEGDFD